MRDHDLATQPQPARKESAHDEAVLLVYPDERPTLHDLIREHGGLKITSSERSPVGDAAIITIQCEDEWAAEGLERAWASFQFFRRMLPPQNARTSRAIGTSNHSYLSISGS
jgi:hypothetical protein